MIAWFVYGFLFIGVGWGIVASVKNHRYYRWAMRQHRRGFNSSDWRYYAYKIDPLIMDYWDIYVAIPWKKLPTHIENLMPPEKALDTGERM